MQTNFKSKYRGKNETLRTTKKGILLPERSRQSHSKRITTDYELPHLYSQGLKKEGRKDRQSCRS
jgi:hypothetical protein